MTGYVKTIWEDQIIERPKTYTMNSNTDGTTTLVDAFGVITNPGTTVSAAALNNMEDGIENAVTVTDEQIIEGAKSFDINPTVNNSLPGLDTTCNTCYKGDVIEDTAVYQVNTAKDADGNIMTNIESRVTADHVNQVSVRLWPYSSVSTAHVDALTVNLTEDGVSSTSLAASPDINDSSTNVTTTEWAVSTAGDNVISGTNNVTGAITFSGTTTLSGTNAFSGTNTFTGTNIFDTSCTFNAANTFNGVNTFTETIQGTSFQSYWADIAEYYAVDTMYPKGTLVCFGGEKEITVATDVCNAVITSEPGFVLNGKRFKNCQAIALIGRVPVRIKGTCKKFDDLCLSDEPGVAWVGNGTVIAKALSAKTEEDEQLVECVVKLKF